MTSHTVYRLTSQEGIDKIQPIQEPIPTILHNEVLVRVRSVALNFRDIAIANAQYPMPVKERVVPGSDMAGEVVQVGAGAEGFAVGDRVIAPVSTGFLYGIVTAKGHLDTLGGGTDGVLAEYIRLPAHSAIKLPKSPLRFSDWAALVTTGSTVWNAFYGSAPLKPGHIVLVLGTGGVSLTALIIAKAAGCTVIVTSSSDEKLEAVKNSYGADHTINYKTHPEWAAEVMRLTDGHGADHVIENGGAGTIEQSLGAVARGGTVSAIGFLATLPPEKMPNVVMLVLMKGAVLRGVLAGSKEQLEEAVRFVGSRGLPMPVYKSFGFDHGSVTQAFRLVESGGQIGKVCINID
ncbi:Zinc-type alcohol dehydrogenase-like protein [Paramyrothecium foliicola]|nr:Zinc-type alcohol dehydrogenase-like protein [Paramyrothecium foliicola]